MQLHNIDHTLYIHFYTLITYTFYITNNYNSDTAPGAAAGDVLKIFANFTGKHLFWGLFFGKVANLQAASLLKRDSCTGNSVSNLRNYSEHLF